MHPVCDTRSIVPISFRLRYWSEEFSQWKKTVARKSFPCRKVYRPGNLVGSRFCRLSVIAAIGSTHTLQATPKIAEVNRCLTKKKKKKEEKIDRQNGII